MEDRRFDALVRSLATGSNRRQVLRGLLALGSGALASGTVLDAGAARRPEPTPKPVRCPGTQIWDGNGCVCPSGVQCGAECCEADAVCCDNACCAGTCYGEELCCPAGNVVCNGDCVAGVCCTDDDCGSGQQCTADYQCGAACGEFSTYCESSGQCVSTYCDPRMQYNPETCVCECEPQYVPVVNTGACGTPCESDADCGGFEGGCRTSVEGQKLCGHCGQSAYSGCTDHYPCTSSAFCQSCASAINTYCAEGVCYTSC